MCGQKWEGKFFTYIFLLCTLYNVLPQRWQIWLMKNQCKGSMMQLGSQKNHCLWIRCLHPQITSPRHIKNICYQHHFLHICILVLHFNYLWDKCWFIFPESPLNILWWYFTYQDHSYWSTSKSQASPCPPDPLFISMRLSWCPSGACLLLVNILGEFTEPTCIPGCLLFSWHSAGCWEFKG